MKKLLIKSFSYKLNKSDMIQMEDVACLESGESICYEGRVMLSEGETKSVSKVLSHLITEYPSFHDD